MLAERAFVVASDTFRIADIPVIAALNGHRDIAAVRDFLVAQSALDIRVNTYATMNTVVLVLIGRGALGFMISLRHEWEFLGYRRSIC